MAAAAGGSCPAESLGYCLAQLRGGAEPGLGRALLALRTRHIKQPGGIERFRARGGLGPLLGLLAGALRPRRTLDLALSILGNCCTEAGSRAQVRELGGIPSLVMILKSLGVESIYNRTARALGNLAIDVANLRAIHDAGAVPPLVQVLASSQDSECLQSVIRALRNLGATPAHRLALAQQGAVRAISERLAASPDDPALAAAAARALLELTKGCSRDCAEQLSLGGGVAPLVALAGHGKRAVREAAVAALSNLCLQGMLRPAVGNAGGVAVLVGELQRRHGAGAAGAVLQPLVRALCLLCREAMNRSRVREAGGLPLLLALLQDGRQRGCHARVVVAFLAFFYDQEALELLQAGGLVALLVGRLDKEAEGESEDERDAASFDFPPEGRRESGLSLLPSCRRSWLLSEGYITSPGDLSPQWSPDGSLSPTLELQDDPPGPGRLPAGLGSPTCLAPPSLDPALAAPEAPALLLLSRFSQAEDPSRSLVTGPVLRGLLAYVTGAPAPLPRCLRLLHRLTCNPVCLEAFVRCHAPSLLRAWLVLGVAPEEAAAVGHETPRSPGSGHRQGRRFKELGEALLCNLCVQAESAFGAGVLTHMLLSGAEADQVACAMALPLICRKKSLCRKLLLEHSGLRLLLAALTRGADPPFTFYAVDSLSLLLGAAAPLPAPPAPKRCRLAAPPPCPYERLAKAGGADLHFRLDAGAPVPASRQAACAGSDVLRAMLAGGFAEARQALVPIRGVAPAPFLVLTHFLHGCRGEPCPALGGPFPPGEGELAEQTLALAEQFLLPELQELVEAALCRQHLRPGAGPEQLYRLGERLGRGQLLRRCARYVLLGASEEPTSRAAALARILRVTGDPKGLAQELLEVAMETPWGVGTDGT
uniref:Armadillo repeat containing 5 n=1 Tax=Chelydra serpentina TaxID=8475 RepID=A0A8C3SH84_CHESE